MLYILIIITKNIPVNEKKIENKEDDPDESIKQRLLQLKDNSNGWYKVQKLNTLVNSS